MFILPVSFFSEHELQSSRLTTGSSAAQMLTEPNKFLYVARPDTSFSTPSEGLAKRACMAPLVQKMVYVDVLQ